jgi:hypothetical protein
MFLVITLPWMKNSQSLSKVEVVTAAVLVELRCIAVIVIVPAAAKTTTKTTATERETSGPTATSSLEEHVK